MIRRSRWVVGVGKETHKHWLMATLEKASPVTGTTSSTTSPVPADDIFPPDWGMRRRSRWVVGVGKETHKHRLMATLEKVSPVTGTTSSTTSPVPADSRL